MTERYYVEAAHHSTPDRWNPSWDFDTEEQAREYCVEKCGKATGYFYRIILRRTEELLIQEYPAKTLVRS